MYYKGNFIGMDFIWWCLWVILLIWIFAIPYDIPGQRRKKAEPLANLKRRLATGEIGMEEYHQLKNLIEIDVVRRS